MEEVQSQNFESVLQHYSILLRRIDRDGIFFVLSIKKKTEQNNQAMKVEYWELDWVVWNLRVNENLAKSFVVVCMASGIIEYLDQSRR